MRVKTTLTLVLLIVILSICETGQAQSNNNGKPKDLELLSKELIGYKLPSFKVKLKNGSIINSSNLKNKVVFVNFWFAGCSPCMAEMDGLNKLYDTLKNNKDFVFLSFTYDSVDITEKTAKKKHIKYTVINMSKDECARIGGGKGYPTSLILGRNGIVKWASVGGPTDEEIASGDIMLVVYPKIKSEF